MLAAEAAPVTARLRRMVGDDAPDVAQEVMLRAWRSAPRQAPEPVLRAWLHRTARNAAIDALRRRRDTVPLADVGAGNEDDRGAREALAALTPHERLVLLLRFEAGLSLREVGALLDIGDDAARKRVARARRAFAAALRAIEAGDHRPVILVLAGGDDPGGYVRWIERAGGRARVLDRDRPLDLAAADGLVLTGSTRDLHPRLYGGAPVAGADLVGDLRDAKALRLALASDLPVVGVCRGAQLLNVLFGGTLHQHVDGHEGERPHRLRTAAGSLTRGALGERPEIVSDHHQAVDRLGRGLRVTAVADDGLVEAVEVPGRRLALGTQWHPERGGDTAVAGLLVAAA